MSSSTKGEVESVKRVFDIVEALEQNGQARVTELANQLGMAKSTVHRHLKTLLNHGYVVKDGNSYRLSFQFLSLGTHTRNQIEGTHLIQQKVEKLTRATQERVQFVVEERGSGVFVYSEKGDHWGNAGTDVGRRVTLHASASGKAILSMLPESCVDEIVASQGLPKLTENTVTTRAELKEELDATRERGYSLNDEENLEDFRSVGVPIVGSNERVIGAFSVSGPTHRFEGETFHDELPVLLREAAEDINIQLTLDKEFPKY